MSLTTAIADNPVLTRELEVRVGGRRGALLITAWLVLITGVFLLAYLGFSSGQGNALQAGKIGRELFDWTLSAMLGLVLLIVPVTTAGAIVNERERQTLASLQLTMMTPLGIVASKLTASIAFVVLLIVATMPVLASCLLIGGVTVWVIVKGLFLVIFTAVVVGAIAMLASAVSRGITQAIVLTLFAVATMVIGSLIALGALAIVDGARGFDTVNPPLAPLVINPVAAVADITAPEIDEDEFTNPFFFSSGDASPLGAARRGLLALQVERARESFDRPVPAGKERTRLWRWYVTVMASVAVLCVGVASEAVRAPARRER